MTTQKTIVLSDERLGFASASKMPAIFACAGMLGMEALVEQQRIQPPDSNPDAEHGTMIHKGVQTGDVSDMEEPDADLVIKIRETEERLVGDWIASTGHTLSDVTVYRELRMWVPGYYSGQADTMVVNHVNRTIFILDTKSGRKAVPPPSRNWQLRSLAVAAFLTRDDIESIRTAIVQPFVKEQPVCDYSRMHLATAAERIKERLDYVRRPGLPRTATSHCEWCSAKHICKEAKESMSLIIRDSARLNWDLVQPAQKLQLWKAACMAEDCVALIKGMIRKELSNDPAAVPGLVKAADQTPRKVSDTAHAVNFLLTQFADKFGREAIIEDLLPKMKISFADLADFYKKYSSIKLTTDEAKKHIAQLCEEWIEVGHRSGRIDVKEEEV